MSRMISQTRAVHFSEDTQDFYASEKNYREMFKKKSAENRNLRKKNEILEKKCAESYVVIERMKMGNIERAQQMYDQEKTIARLQAEILLLKKKENPMVEE